MMAEEGESYQDIRTPWSSLTHYQSSICSDHAKTFGQSVVCISGDVSSPRKETAWQDGHFDHDCTAPRPQSCTFTLQSSCTVMRELPQNKHLGGLFKSSFIGFFVLFCTQNSWHMPFKISFDRGYIVMLLPSENSAF